MVRCIILGVTGFSEDFVLAITADPDEMPQHAAFHLCLHCLHKYPSRVPVCKNDKRMTCHMQ